MPGSYQCRPGRDLGSLVSDSSHFHAGLLLVPSLQDPGCFVSDSSHFHAGLLQCRPCGTRDVQFLIPGISTPDSYQCRPGRDLGCFVSDSSHFHAGLLLVPSLQDPGCFVSDSRHFLAGLLPVPSRTGLGISWIYFPAFPCRAPTSAVPGGTRGVQFLIPGVSMPGSYQCRPCGLGMFCF